MIKHKMLLVDDSATSRALFRACIPQIESYEIKEAASYETAINHLNGFNPDLCILDYNLPDKHGTEIARYLLDHQQKPKFILLTANTQKAVLAEAEALGFTAVIEKPINSTVIANMLQEIT